jgi:hypothetical protein
MTKKQASAAAGETSPAGSRTLELIGAPRRWFARAFRAQSGRASVQLDRRSAEEDPLLAFEVERTAVPVVSLRSGSLAPRTAVRSSRIGRVFAIAGLVAVTLVVVGVARGRWPVADPASGNLTLNTRPAGVAVLVDGREVGTTPLSIALPPGEHRLTLKRGTDERELPVTLVAAGQVTQYLEFGTPDAPPALGGKISVVTDPPGARVQIDGVARGTSPLTVGDLAPAEHTVAVSSEASSAKRTISVENGATASVVFSLVKVATSTAGWVTLTAPIDLQISEDDEVVATGRAARIMLEAGHHAIRLKNDVLQYDETRQVDVVAGKTITLKVDPPKVPLSVNARPWADVIIDGTNAGQTPISNLSVAVGQHDVIFRHPQLGERRRTIVVTMRDSNRIAVDFTQP